MMQLIVSQQMIFFLYHVINQENDKKFIIRINCFLSYRPILSKFMMKFLSLEIKEQIKYTKIKVKESASHTYDYHDTYYADPSTDRAKSYNLPNQPL